MSKPTFTLALVQADKHHTVILVRKQGHGKMEFRGDAIWQWGLGMTTSDPARDHIRQHGTRICWAEWLHNGLSGVHTTIFYANELGQEFAVHDRHDDYAFVEHLWQLGELTDAEVLAKIN